MERREEARVKMNICGGIHLGLWNRDLAIKRGSVFRNIRAITRVNYLENL